MEVIVIESKAFRQLRDDLITRLEQAIQSAQAPKDDWIPFEEATRLLNVKSKTTMQELRDKGAIVFSQPSRKVILYSRASIMEYLRKNSNS